MRTRVTAVAVALLAAAVLGHAGNQAAAQKDPAKDAKQDTGKRFQVPKDAIKGAVKTVDLSKNAFTITLQNNKDRTFTVGKTTEFWGPNGGDRGTGPAGLKDDCMAAGYEIQVVAAKDGKMAKDVFFPERKKADPKKESKSNLSAAAQKKIAKAISTGHSYEKHVIDEKLFPEVKSENDFMAVIGKVLASPTHHRDLENDREAFYDSKSNTIVIYNPHARDNGTCFRPREGLKYFLNLK
jgi:hypothetical protein